MRRFLDGRFENSVFCLLSPDGENWLTQSGRGPQQVFRQLDAFLTGLEEMPEDYKVSGDPAEAIVQDFHSLGQAINVASADQRVLVVVAGSEEKTAPLRTSLRPVAWSSENVGRFHWNFETGPVRELIKDAKSEEGIFLVRPGEFGLEGTVLQALPLNADPAQITKALHAANAEFAKTTAKKVYSSHVAEGRKQGINYESEIPYGEDRDGDGVIDHSPALRRGGR